MRPDPGAVAREHVNGPGVHRRVVGLVAANAGRCAVLGGRTDGQRVAGEYHWLAEAVARFRVRGLDVGILRKKRRALPRDRHRIERGRDAVLGRDFDLDRIGAFGQRHVGARRTGLAVVHAHGRGRVLGACIDMHGCHQETDLGRVVELSRLKDLIEINARDGQRREVRVAAEHAPAAATIIAAAAATAGRQQHRE